MLTPVWQPDIFKIIVQNSITYFKNWSKSSINSKIIYVLCTQDFKAKLVENPTPKFRHPMKKLNFNDLFSRESWSEVSKTFVFQVGRYAGLCVIFM